MSSNKVNKMSIYYYKVIGMSQHNEINYWQSLQVRAVTVFEFKPNKQTKTQTNKQTLQTIYIYIYIYIIFTSVLCEC